MNRTRPTTSSPANVEHAGVPDFREHMLGRRHLIPDAVHYAMDHRTSEPSVAAEVTRLQTELTMPTEPAKPRLTPEQAAEIVERAFVTTDESETPDPEMEQYNNPDGASHESPADPIDLTAEDSLRDHRDYIASLYPAVDERNQDDYGLIS